MSNQMFCDAFIVAGLFYLGLCLCVIGRQALAVSFLPEL